MGVGTVPVFEVLHLFYLVFDLLAVVLQLLLHLLTLPVQASALVLTGFFSLGGHSIFFPDLAAQVPEVLESLDGQAVKDLVPVISALLVLCSEFLVMGF